MPARQALVPALVGRDRVTNAVALHAAGTSTQAMLAPAVGGVLYAVIGPDGAYYVGAALGFAALALTSLIPNGVGSARASGSPMLAEIKSGLAYVRRNDVLVAVMAMVVVMLLLVQALPFLLPIVVVEVYERDSGSFGLLLSALGLGSLLGSIAIATAKRWRPGLILIGGALIAGLAMLAMAMVPFYLAGLVFLMGVGLSDAARRTLSNAIVMEQVEDAYMGRVLSVYYMAAGLLPASLLVSGLAIDALGSQVTIGSMGVLLIVSSLVMLATQRALRDLR
jgi:MFS family permease